MCRCLRLISFYYISIIILVISKFNQYQSPDLHHQHWHHDGDDDDDLEKGLPPDPSPNSPSASNTYSASFTNLGELSLIWTYIENCVNTPWLKWAQIVGTAGEVQIHPLKANQFTGTRHSFVFVPMPKSVFLSFFGLAFIFRKKNR